MKNFILFSTLLFSLSSKAVVDPVPNAMSLTSKMYLRLAGRPLPLRHPERETWIQMVEAGKAFEVAHLMGKETSFIDQVSLQWAVRYLSAEKATEMPLQDALATVIGVIRDGRDARQLLTGDFVYAPPKRLGLGRPITSTNAVYQEMEKRALEYSKFLQILTPQWEISQPKEAAGLLTSRWWADTYYQAGTNRRAVVGLMNVFMCQPVESWKTSNLSIQRIRQDIPRDPSGDPRIFQQECRSCHAPMDAMAGAFAYINFANENLTFSGNVTPKYLQLSDTYPEGYVTTDNSWKNFLTTRPDLNLEWSKITQGKGIKELGEMLVDSKGFGRCLAKRSVNYFCGKQLPLNDPWVLELSELLQKKDNQNLQELFFRIVSSQNC